MHRIDTPDVSVDKHGSGKDGYKDGVPPGESPTSLDADMFDTFQEEIVGVVEASGEALDKTNLAQLLEAIDFRLHAQAAMTWTQQTDAGTATDCVASEHIDGTELIVIMGSATNGQRSTDGGITWASVTGQSQSTEEIAYGSGVFIAVGSGSINIQSSSNSGVTWVSEATGSGVGSDVVYDATIGLWCVVGSDTGPWIVTSPDGLAWTARTPVNTELLNGVASNGSIFVAVGEAGQIQSSPDGITWTSRTADASYTDNFNDVVWTGSVFVAAGDQSEAQTSPDGITWTSHTVPEVSTNEHVWDVGGLIVIQGNTNYYNHGKCDGPWLKVPSNGLPSGAAGTNRVLSMDYNLGRVVACTTLDDIFTSNGFGLE